MPSGKYYTGIGSRETPEEILELMTEIAYKLAKTDWILRSGGADGADKAFEAGWHDARYTTKTAKPTAEIFIPWNGFSDRRHGDFNNSYIVPQQEDMELAMEIASVIHPGWNERKKDGSPVLSDAAKKLHARNCFQVLGIDLETPSRFLLCWSKPQGNSISGGTRTAWELAKNHQIPCYNLWDEKTKERLIRYVSQESLQ